MSDMKGVQLLPPSSPLISESIKKAVDHLLSTVPADDPSVLGYEIGITTDRGINAAIAYRRIDPNGRWSWEAGTYVGKHWDGGFNGGVYFKGVVR